jgi:hypothetical protein
MIALAAGHIQPLTRRQKRFRADRNTSRPEAKSRRRDDGSGQADIRACDITTTQP